jgi:hypothetical protein
LLTLIPVIRNATAVHAKPTEKVTDATKIGREAIVSSNFLTFFTLRRVRIQNASIGGKFVLRKIFRTFIYLFFFFDEKILLFLLLFFSTEIITTTTTTTTNASHTPKKTTF